MGDFAEKIMESENFRGAADQVVNQAIQDEEAAQATNRPAVEPQVARPAIHGTNPDAIAMVDQAFAEAVQSQAAAKLQAESNQTDPTRRNEDAQKMVSDAINAAYARIDAASKS